MALKLQAEVGLDGSGFHSGLKTMERGVEKLKEVAVAAFGAWTIESAFKKTIESAKELVVATDRLGTSGVEATQVLRQAAKDAGLEFSKLEKSLEKISEARQKIFAGGEEGAKMGEAAARLGIGDKELQTMNNVELLFGPIKTAAASMNREVFEPLLKQATGMKTAGEIIPLLSVDLEELSHHMEDMGAIMSTETAVKLKHLGDGLDLFEQVLLNAFAPAILRIAAMLEDGIGDFLAWLDKRMRPEEEPKPEQSRGRGGLGKFGKGVAGVGVGLLGLWDEFGANIGIPGAEENANKRIDTANRLFNEAGIGDGILDAIAEGMANSIKNGKPLKKAYDEARKKAEEAINTEIYRLTHPNETPDEGGAVKMPKSHKIKDSSDALIRVGNFLGSSKDALSSALQEQVMYLKQIALNTTPQPLNAASTNYPP
jgi:hypothetical protein